MALLDSLDLTALVDLVYLAAMVDTTNGLFWSTRRFFTAGFYSWALYGTLLYYGNVYIRTTLALCVLLLIYNAEGIPCMSTLLNTPGG